MIDWEDIQVALRRTKPRIIEHRWVPEGEVYLINDLNLPVAHPPDWDTLSAVQKLEWGVDNAMTILTPPIELEPVSG